MASKQKPKADLMSDEEVRAALLASDPTMFERAAKLLEEIRNGEHAGPYLTAETLPDFLREFD